MDKPTNDIESVIIDIERAELIAGDMTLDRAVREDELMRFIKREAQPIIELLDELKQFRAKAAEDGGSIGGPDKTHRAILEGFSDESAEAALSSALDKAAHYFAENQDVSITVQQLIELPNGGHRATLEVHVTPFSQRQALQVKGLDIELKRGKEKEYQEDREEEAEKLHNLVFEHFSALTKSKTVGKIPASFLININDVKLMHYMLEKQFLRAEMAEHAAAEKEDSPDEPHQILVRFNKREPD